MIYSHNFSPHKYFIWNNQDIKFKNKSLYIQKWVDRNILLVSQLLNDDGQLFSYKEFLFVYDFPVTPREYAVVFDAIPDGVRRLLVYAPTGRNCTIPELNPGSKFIGNIWGDGGTGVKCSPRNQKVAGSSPAQSVAVVVSLGKTHVACWWWSEGPVAPVLGSLASVSAPQGSCGYIVSNFHSQLLSSWLMIYSHNFSPHKYFIWNNQDIKFKNKSLYIQKWVDRNILLVSQLLNDDGQLFSYKEFLFVYDFPVTPREYAVVFDAIPDGVRRLLVSAPKGRNCIIPELNPGSIFIGNICPLLSDKATNQCIRQIIQRDIVSKPAAVFYWNNIYNDIDWKNTWILPRKFIITNKIREVSFKLIHRCYPVKTYLVKRKKNIDTLCTFCGNAEETICHLFWDCTYTHVFWIDLNNFINTKINPSCKLKFHHILFGLTYR
uniref:Reverse transcriptase zinc-binding domain-containing protein n=1 Tax=Nothobranchius furzeri TaxID=105023 RepID=A0A8C6KMK1_NOTFU